MPLDNGPPYPPPRPSLSPQGRVGPRPDFMKYPYPETERMLARIETLPGVKEETKGCITNLLDYRAVRSRARLPRGPSAAVLVPLFVGRSGDLYVVLSRRSDALKTFAGDTALPGGKVDAQDVTVEDTARREAFEEIGLPQDKERVPLLCVMEPHLAKGEILVTPVVVLILDHGLQPNLNSSEVTLIFAQPLISFLSSTPHLSGGRTADLNNPYHTFTDLPWSDGGTVRLHGFRTGREAEGVKPVFGLTAAILIKTATIGYGRTPEFEVQPVNAPTPAQQIAYALLTPANSLRIACEQEGIDVNESAARLLRPPIAANARRTIEWEKIGTEWKRLVDGDNAADASGRLNPTVGKGREERLDAIPDMAKLGEFLDKTRDMVNERMKEVQSDEKKLAKARKAYPKIVEQVKRRLGGARNGDGDLDLEVLFAMILKEVREGLRGSIDAGMEGVKTAKGQIDGGDGRDQGVERGKECKRRDSEEMKKYIDKGGDGHDPEQPFSRKRGAKL